MNLTSVQVIFVVDTIVSYYYIYYEYYLNRRYCLFWKKIVDYLLGSKFTKQIFYFAERGCLKKELIVYFYVMLICLFLLHFR